MEQTECSETSAYKIQTPGNYPEENIQHTEHGLLILEVFLDHTWWRTTVGRTPPDERSARRRDLYLTTHNTHNKHPCPRWDSNFTISAGKWPQTYALDRAATGTGMYTFSIINKASVQTHNLLACSIVPQKTAPLEDCKELPHIRTNMVRGTVFKMRQSQLYRYGYK